MLPPKILWIGFYLIGFCIIYLLVIVVFITIVNLRYVFDDKNVYIRKGRLVQNDRSVDSVDILFAVFGLKLDEEGKITYAYEERLLHVAKLIYDAIEKKMTVAITISGGPTREIIGIEDTPTEAEEGLKFLFKYFKIEIPKDSIWLEKEAHSTLENIKYVKNIVEEEERPHVKKIVVITGKTWVRRVKLLSEPLLEICETLQIEGAEDSSLFGQLYESLVVLPLYHLDPAEKTIVKHTLNEFRNVTSAPN